MNRPLIVSDCDEVLLHMVSHFRDWLGEEHAVDFAMDGDFSTALTHRGSGEVLDQRETWRLLGGFFDTEMDRQLPIAGALEAMRALSEKADVVILTNLTDERQERRTRQLAALGLDVRVFTNQGPKGPALKRIVEEYRPSRTFFIDDLPQHHQSARETFADIDAEITTLHLCGEPLVAPHIACAHQAGHADARIDDWARALPWLMEQLEKEARMSIADRLDELGIELPKAAAPVASYQPLVVQGNWCYLSGQLPFIDGELVTGKLGVHLDTARGQEAARACGLMILAQLQAHDLLERVEQVVKLGGFVASAPDFVDQPKVVNGASDLMADVFGEAGKHARSAVGVPVLPLNAAVEVDAVFALSGA